MSEKDGNGNNDERAQSSGQPPGDARLLSAKALAIRYRAHAVDLRQLANTHRSGATRRRLLEIAAEFEELAAQLERGTG